MTPSVSDVGGYAVVILCYMLCIVILLMEFSQMKLGNSIQSCVTYRCQFDHFGDRGDWILAGKCSNITYFWIMAISLLARW